MTIQIFKALVSRTLKNLSSPHHKSHLSFALPLLFSTSSASIIKNPSPISQYLVEKYEFSPETASKAASAVSHLKTPEKCDSVLSYLKETGFSKTQLENVAVIAPQVLCANLDKTIKPKIKIFQDLGFSASFIVDLFSNDPWIFMCSADNRIAPTLLVLKNVLGSVSEVARVLKLCGWFFKYDLEKTVLPNLEFMKRCGIDSSQLVNHMYNFPRFFLNKPEKVKNYVDKVNEMGFDKNSKMFLYAVTAVGSMTGPNLEKKLELFCSLGFSNDEILSMFKKRPQVFAVSARKIREVVQVILGTRKYDISIILEHPGMLLASIEARLKPRLQVLEILENKGMLGKRPGLSSVYRISDKEFSTRYVAPNLKELDQIYFTKHPALRKFQPCRRDSYTK